MRTRDEGKEQAIRAKAVKMLVKSGFEGLSMQKLAKAAGVSPATIYIYFKDREDLIKQLGAEEGKKFVAASLQGFDPDMPFAEGMLVQWRNRARYCMDNPDAMHFMEQIRYSPFQDKLYKIDTNFLIAMRTFCNNAIKRKELIPLPFEIFWSVAYAPLYQLIRFQISPRTMPDHKDFQLTDKVLKKTLTLVLKGLTP